jgi:peptide/nickel transport system permease protein
MLRFITLRVLRAIVTLFGISIVTFLLFFVAPANPAEVMCSRNCDAHRIAEVQHSLGLDKPVLTQYTEFVRGIFIGRDYGEGDFFRHCPAPCLGYSYRDNEPVVDIISRTLPVTLSIVIGAGILWVLFGVTLGVISALRRGTIFDKASIGISLIGASFQVQFLGLILLGIFVYGLKLMPYPQYVSIFSDPGGWLLAMILPWATLTLYNSALYARLARATMLETLSEDYVRTARAKGVKKLRVYIRHALRAAINPIVTIAGLDIGIALGGTVITETVFSLQGLGRTAVIGANSLNLPVVMATVMLAAVFIVVANIVVDGLYAAIDPRVRLGS